LNVDEIDTSPPFLVWITTLVDEIIQRVSNGDGGRSREKQRYNEKQAQVIFGGPSIFFYKLCLIWQLVSGLGAGVGWTLAEQCQVSPSFLEAAGAVLNIGSSLKPNHHREI